MSCCKTNAGEVLKELGYTRIRLKRIPAIQNSAETLDARVLYCRIISVVEDRRLYFLDETGFNPHTSTTYGYALANQDPYITVPINRGQNVSVLTVIYVTGLVSFSVMQGAVDRETLVSYLEDEMYPRMPSAEGAVLVMDNARIHHGNDVTRWVTRKHLRLEYLPVSSPHLNPIENFFSVVKAHYERHRPRPETFEDLEAVLLSTLQEFSEMDLSNFYREMRRYVEMGMQRQPFIG